MLKLSFLSILIFILIGCSRTEESSKGNPDQKDNVSMEIKLTSDAAVKRFMDSLRTAGIAFSVTIDGNSSTNILNPDSLDSSKLTLVNAKKLKL